ncbi:TetR family transcriptional regulator [Pseudomonadales bacterium]|mgnify:FL=1|nr:TetR family transcriptional regulator [Pseudomonadales bacterium]MDG1003136.1 TetR family transcriptional regulator [Pseudomonadales bacterium]MDG1909598.1 TetR family transcriptional regulator [Pseudomonadales bacterium]|tara:strand:+ start:769 stop:1347 length:579 start_codon:yes stop_codon:yes gene_type:complete
MTREKVDGRMERRRASRRKIIDCTRELIIEGYAEPTAEQVSHRTSLTTRTLFRHFPDMKSLYLEVLSEGRELALAVMDEPLPPGNTTQMLRTIVERRARVYEHLLPTQISRTMLLHRSDQAKSDTRNDVKRRRKRLRAILPPEAIADPLMFEAIDGVLGVMFWVSLRRDQKLSAKRAQEVMLRAALRLTDTS